MISAHLKMFCSDKISEIENYDIAKDSSEMWVCHHRLETDRGFT